MFSDDFRSYKTRVLQYSDKFAEMTNEKKRKQLQNTANMRKKIAYLCRNLHKAEENIYAFQQKCP